MVHPVTPVGYEVILLRGGGKKKRRIGARNFTYLCVHDLDKYNCSECHGSRLCEVRPFVLATPVNHHHHDPAWRSLPTRPEAAKESATPGAINAYLQLTPPPRGGGGGGAGGRPPPPPPPPGAAAAVRADGRTDGRAVGVNRARPPV